VTLRRARATALAFAGYVVAALGATWPTILSPVRFIANDLGDPILCTVILAWEADRALHGFRGFWDAPYFFPRHHTLAYAEHLIGIAVFTTPFEWLTRNPVLVYNSAYIASYVLAGFGMFLLARAILGRADAAFMAGLAFALTPYRLAQSSHLQVLLSGWMPIALLALHRFLGGGRWPWLALFTAAFLLTGLSNTYYMYFFLLPIAVIVAVELVRPRLPRLRTVSAMAGAGAVSACVLAPVGLVYYGLQRDRGFARSLDEAAGMSARLTDYLTVTPDRGWTWFHLLKAGGGERELFQGFAVMAVAALGIAAWARRTDRSPLGTPWRREILTYALILVLAVWLSMGPGFLRPYGLLFHVIPGLSGLRVPARFAMIVSLALAVLAGAGFAWIFARVSRPAALVIALAGAALMATEGQHGVNVARVPVPADRTWERVAYEWLRDSPPGGAIELNLTRIADLQPYTTSFQLNAVEHKHPIVNGYAGWTTPLQELLGAPSGPLHEHGEMAAALEGLRAIGVRYVLLHRYTYRYHPEEAARVAAEIDRSGEAVESHRFGDTSAWRLADVAPVRPGDAAALAPIDPKTFVLDASQGRDRLGAIADGDIDTRWLTGRPQDGTEWVTATLPRAADIGRVDLDLEDRTALEYPRRVAIDGIDAAGAPHTLFEGSVLPRLIPSVAASHGSDIPVSLDLPANQTVTLRIRQTGVSRTSWSVHELRLWKRN
jgi:hypothetical protein